MLIGVLGFLIGLGLTLMKSYSDAGEVGFGYYKVLLSFLPDLVLVIGVVVGLKKSWRRFSFYLALSSVILFYGMLALNGKGSSQLACSATGYCDNSVVIVCSKLSNKPYVGILYLVGEGIKIMASTYIAKMIFVEKPNEVVPDANLTSLHI